ncbi:hypothetical protein BK724_00025 [Bacillus thuringiensis serovar sooncheon]|nr:hypothetical protein BK724_00025 [Bacillus thuringiensis serovar sooncheon]
MGGANVKVTVGTFADVNNSEMPGFNKYVKIERIGETGDIWIYRDLQMPLGDGIISMWARSQTNDSKSVPALGVKDNADALTGQPGVKYFISNVPGEMRDGKWHQFHFNCKIEHGKVRVYFGQRQGTPVGSVVYVTGVKLAQGNMKDNWSKSPSDMTTNTEFTKKTAEIITSVDQVSSKLSKTEQNVTTVSNDVKKAQETANNADKKAQEAQTQITATNKKVSEVAQTVDGLQVNISNVTKIQTQQGNDIKNAQTELQKQSSQIKATAEAIATKVSAEYVQDYTGGLSINNKFRDADFALAADKNLKYWDVNKGGDGNVEFLKGSGHEGFNSCRVTGRADSTQAHANFSHFFAAGEIVGEVDYVVSVYAFAEKAPASDKYASVYFNYHRSDGTQISQEGKQLNLAVGAHIKTDVPFKPPTGTVRTRIRFYVAGVGFVVRFSKPMVSNGTVGTTFNLNPKDYTDYDKLVDDIASRVLTEDYNKKITEMNTKFTQTSKALEFKAEAKNVYTKNEVDSRDDAVVETMNARFKVQADEISSKVSRGSIISSINQTAEKIKISAALIDLVGKVEASWLKAGLLIGMTIKTSNSTEHLHMENQVVRFVNQGSDKMVIGFENERKSKTRNPYIILGEGDGSGKNFGSIYKDGNGVYYRYVDLNGAESNIRLTNAGNIGITAQDGFWVNSKRANFNSTIEVPAIRFTSLGKTPGSQQGNFWIGNGYKGFGIYYYDNYWKFVQGS